MKKTVLFIFLFVFSTSALVGQNINDIYEDMAAERWDAALEQLQPMLEKRRKNEEALWLAAICHMHRYRFEQAFEYFQQAEGYAEIDPFFYVPYAQAYLFSGNPDQAERVLRRASITEIDDFFKKDYTKVLNQVRAAKNFMANPEPVVVENLGAEINSEKNEYSPVMLPDGQGILFSATSEEVNDDTAPENYSEVVKTATKDDFDRLVNKKEVEGLNSNKDILAPIQVLGDEGKVVYFKNGRLFMAEKRPDGSYDGEEGLPIDPKEESFDLYAHFYNGGKSVVFSSSRDNENGKTDLYMNHEIDGRWGRPFPLRELNTEYNEDAPFVAADGTLYFASRGHNSIGGYDIFKTRLDSSTNVFSTPENLGVPINLPGDDSFFIRDGQFAYFSSNRAVGYGESDIYRVLLFDRTMLQGKLITCDMVALSGAIIQVKDLEHNLEAEAIADDYGVYHIDVPIVKDVQVIIRHKDQVVYDRVHQFKTLFKEEFDVEFDFKIGGCERVERNIYLSLVNSYDLDPMDLDVEEPSIEGVIVEVAEVEEELTDIVEEEELEEDDRVDGLAIKVPDVALPIIYFDFDKSTFKDEFSDELSQVAEILKEHPNVRLQVAGHTDSYGDYQYNVALGLRRAQSVIDFLVQKGIDMNRLEKGTSSEDLPIASNETVQGRAYNRRVELNFIGNK